MKTDPLTSEVQAIILNQKHGKYSTAKECNAARPRPFGLD